MSRFRNIQAQVQRTRASRIQISYADLLPDGSTNKGGDIPFVIGVIADMSINPDPDRGALRNPDRKFVTVHKDNFDEVLKGFKAHLRFQVPNVIEGGDKSLFVEIRPKNIADLQPDRLIEQVGLLQETEAVLRRLSNLSSILDNHPEIEDRLTALVRSPEERARLIAAVEPKTPVSDANPGIGGSDR